MRQALGKGIGALIPSATTRTRQAGSAPIEAGQHRAHGSVQQIPIAAVSLNPRQPRQHFEQSELDDLGRSVALHGILQPILVRPLADGRFELIAGERRLRAARLAALETIPAVVKQADDAASLVLAIVENVQRADLFPLEEARAYRELMREFSLTQEQVAERVGKSRPAVANTLRLLQLPEEVQADLAAGRITAGHARALLALETDAARVAFAREIANRRLSVRQAEHEAARSRPAPSPPASIDPDLARIESDLGRALGTKASVRLSRGAKGGGHIELAFYSDDDLARLCDLLLASATHKAPRAHRA